MAPAANHLVGDLLCKLDQLGRAVAAVMPLEPALAALALQAAGPFNRLALRKNVHTTLC